MMPRSIAHGLQVRYAGAWGGDIRIFDSRSVRVGRRVVDAFLEVLPGSVINEPGFVKLPTIQYTKYSTYAIEIAKLPSQ